MSIKKPNTTYFGYMHEMPRDKRQKRWKKEQRKFGFDSSELWNLDNTIAQFIYPRLKMFAENPIGHPGGMTYEEWKSILADMTEAFRLASDEKEDAWWNEEKCKTIQKGLDLFAKYFGNLWN